MTSPDIISRGFIYMPNEEVMNGCETNFAAPCSNFQANRPGPFQAELKDT